MSEILEAWGLKDLSPFRGVPGSIKELMQVFVDREDAMKTAKYILSTGENVLVRGMSGIGKTAFIMATLHQMEQQGDVLGRPVLPIHIRQFEGGTRQDFHRVVLYALAKRLGPRHKRAREIVRALTGEQITRGQKRGLSVGIEVGAPQLFGAKAGGELGGEESQVLKIDDPTHFVDELLDAAIRKKKYQRVIIAVDDLEKCPNQGGIKAMFESTLDLLRDSRCGFILTGRKLTILQDVYHSSSGLDIYNTEIPMKPLSSDELRLIAIRTLNLVRHHPHEDSTHPFAEFVVEKMASKAFGIPRQFILLCGAIQRLAFLNDETEIPPEVFEKLFDKYQDELQDSDVPPDIRRILYLGLQQRGFSISKDAELDEVFEIIGITTLRQFIDFADNLVQQDLLQRFTDDRGEVLYRLAPGVEKLALSGAPAEGKTESLLSDGV
jgi:Cdc6-like AAA superfamily ATPase